METSDFRPKLKQDSIFLPLHDGVVLRNGSNVFTLKGQTVYGWLSTLAPHLTGEQTLEELCESLEPTRQEMVVKLVTTLFEKGIVKNHVREEPDVLTDRLRERFRQQVELIDHHTDSPGRRFADFRQSRVLLAGSGESFKALARALARNGLESINLAPAGLTPSALGDLEAELSALEREGLDIQWTINPLDALEVAKLGGQYQAVTYCCDDFNLETVRRLGEGCYRAGITFLPGFVFRGQSLIGPLVRPGARGCWLCAALRYTTNLESGHASAFWRSVALGDFSFDRGGAISIPAARILGNSVAFELFKEFTKFVNPESESAVLTQDLETLECYTDSLMPHPLCAVCGETSVQAEMERVREVVEGRHDSPRTTEQLLNSWYTRLNPRFGIFKGFRDDEVEQIPLRTSLVEVGDVRHNPAGASSVRGVSLDTAALARFSALERAVGHYSRELIDRRGFSYASGAQLRADGAIPVMPEELSLWSGGPTFSDAAEVAWAAGRALLSPGARYIPAAAAFSDTSLNHPGIFEKTAAGSVTASRWDDLLLRGLVSALGYERLLDILRGRGSVRALDNELLAGHEKDIAYLLKVAGRLGVAPQLFELVGVSPVKVVLARAEGVAGSEGGQGEVAFDGSLSGAAREALTNLVLAITGGAEGSAVTSPLADFALPPDCVIHPPARGVEEGQATVDSLMRFIGESGREVFFIHTTPPDIRQTETFITGKVLLSRPAAVAG